MFFEWGGQKFSAGRGRLTDGVSPNELVADVMLFGAQAEMVERLKHSQLSHGYL